MTIQLLVLHEMAFLDVSFRAGLKIIVFNMKHSEAVNICSWHPVGDVNNVNNSSGGRLELSPTLLILIGKGRDIIKRFVILIIICQKL